MHFEREKLGWKKRNRDRVSFPGSGLSLFLSQNLLLPPRLGEISPSPSKWVSLLSFPVKTTISTRNVPKNVNYFTIAFAFFNSELLRRTKSEIPLIWTSRGKGKLKSEKWKPGSRKLWKKPFCSEPYFQEILFLEKSKESLRWDEERNDAKVIFESGRSQPRVFYNNLFYAKIRWRKSALETKAKKVKYFANAVWKEARHV